MTICETHVIPHIPNIGYVRIHEDEDIQRYLNIYIYIHIYLFGGLESAAPQGARKSEGLQPPSEMRVQGAES